MPPRATTAAPTRASTRTRTTPGTSSSENVPNTSTTTTTTGRTTRSTRAASGSGGPSTTTRGGKTSGSGSGSTGISELITKKLRPLTDRNASTSAAPTPSSPDPIPESGAAMLAATRQALRRVNTAPKPEESEPLKAYLRIKPDLSNTPSSTPPYLTLISPTEAEMIPPTTIMSGITPIRVPNPSSRHQTFSFSRVFPPSTCQSELFTITTLPLLKDLLNGENGLLFAYGVTNSGKTYTVQGQSGHEEAGILPRALDVVFNSIQGHQADYHEEQEAATATTPAVEAIGAENALVHDLLEETEESQSTARESAVVPIDPAWEYKIYISYAEVYNNQIFDLLNTGSSTGTNNITPSASADNNPRLGGNRNSPQPNANANGRNSTAGGGHRGSFLQTSFMSLNPFSWIGNGNGSSAASGPNPRGGRPGAGGINRGSILSSSSIPTTTISRQALPLRSDPSKPGSGKYVANLTEVLVQSADEARKVVAMGQVNRRVFGTVANASSSRSHAIFTVRVERVKRGVEKDTEIVDSARLSIVDLAGSERNKNTQATGERMDEANKINSSLMVLGQCMRILRNNQKKLAKAGAGRAVRTEIPPYRMSKLTELFQEFFEGRGRAAMIVNVNPYDTGYHENAAVMEFSALASEISTVTTKIAPTLSRKLSTASIAEASKSTPNSAAATGTPRASVEPAVRRVRLSLAAGPGGTAAVDTVIEVVEEAEEPNEEEEEESDEEDDTLISRLFEELEAMRARWIDAEIRCALVEAETRESVMQEMEERMRNMERMHAERLKRETEQQERMMDMKLEMLAGTQTETESEEDDLVERSIVEQSLLHDRDETASPSPPEVIRSKNGKRFALSDGPDEIIPSIRAVTKSTYNDELPDVPPLAPYEPSSSSPARAYEGDESRDDEDDDDESEEEEDEDEEDEDEWVPSTSSKAKPKSKHTRTSPSPTPSDSEVEDDDSPAPRSKGTKSKSHTKRDSTSSAASSSAPKSRSQRTPLNAKLDTARFLSPDDTLDEPAIVPNKKARAEAMSVLSDAEGRTYVPDVGEPGVVKKKKRHLGGKAPVLTEDDILEVAARADSQATGTGTGRGGTRGAGSIRRMERRSR